MFYNIFIIYCAGIVLCFGGGVLLSTVLLHMVREVRESIARATALAMLPGMEEYPFAELLIGLGNILPVLHNPIIFISLYV